MMTWILLLAPHLLRCHGDFHDSYGRIYDEREVEEMGGSGSILGGLLRRSRESPVMMTSYCETEIFQAMCPTPDQVVLIRKARYGRMRINRCVKLDYGHLGCVIDATEMAGERCNARRKCEIRVPDPQFASLRPCPDDLKPYLEVAYDCLRVETPTIICKDQKPIMAKVRPLIPSIPARPNLPHTNPFTRRNPRQSLNPYPAGRHFFYPERSDHMGGVLASSTTDLTNCGGAKSPWIVEAAEGQSIQVTLVEFRTGGRPAWQNSSSVKNDSRSDLDVLELPSPSDRCPLHAVVMETKYESNKKGGSYLGKVQVTNMTSCEKGSMVHTSLSNRIEIALLGRGMDALVSRPHFLLEYKVIGCPDMKSSQALQWRRTSHVTSLVTCTNTSGSRELVCQDNKWSNGAINCSSPVAVKDFPSITETAKGDNSTALSYGLSLTIITALTLAIGTFILCAGLIVAKKCKSSCLISSIIDHTIDNQFNTNLSSNQYGSIDDNKYQDGHFVHDIKISQFTSLASPNAALVCSMSKFNPAHRIHPHPSNAVATATKILRRCCHDNGEWTSSQLIGGTSFNAGDWTRPQEVKQMEERNFTGCKYHLHSNRLHGNLVPLPPASSSCHHGLWKESQLDLDSSPNVVPPNVRRVPLIAGSQKCIIDQFHINSTPIHMNRRPITNKNNNNNVNNNNSNVGDEDEHHHISPHPHPHPHPHRQQHHNHVYPQLVSDFGSSIDEGQGREGLI